MTEAQWHMAWPHGHWAGSDPGRAGTISLTLGVNPGGLIDGWGHYAVLALLRSLVANTLPLHTGLAYFAVKSSQFPPSRPVGGRGQEAGCCAVEGGPWVRKRSFSIQSHLSICPFPPTATADAG